MLTIKDWNFLTDSPISVAECAEHSVIKFTFSWKGKRSSLPFTGELCVCGRIARNLSLFCF